MYSKPIFLSLSFVTFSADLFRYKLFHNAVNLGGFQIGRPASRHEHKIVALPRLLPQLGLQHAESFS